MPPVSCSHELHWLVPEHTSHSGVISPHLLINPADLLGFGLGQGGWMEEGEGFLCRCQGCHLNTRWQCHVAGEFCFIFSLDPVLGLILPSSVYLSRILGDAPTYLPPPPCKCVSSSTDSLFWNSAFPIPGWWDPHPLLWTHHPFQSVDTGSSGPDGPSEAALSLRTSPRT